MPPPNPFELFADVFAQAQKLEIDNPNAMHLATVDAEGQPSVRVVLLYAGWKRTGPGPREFQLVRSRVAPVYPQSQFGVSRRVALDGVMRRLGVGPYTDTPIQLVTALMRW